MFYNWLLNGLYVPPQGRLSPSSYLSALFRIVIVYTFVAQVLSVFAPTIQSTFNSDQPNDIFQGVKWGQIAAIIVIAFPLWSAFQRRINDMRPDIREKLNALSVAFPLLLTGLIGLMIANTAGIAIPLDDADLSSVRFWFAVMLFGSAFVLGGDTVPAKTETSTKQAADTFEFATKKAVREAIATQIGARPPEPFAPEKRTDRPKSAYATDFPNVMQRTRKLPHHGRIKPGWFS